MSDIGLPQNMHAVTENQLGPMKTGTQVWRRAGGMPVLVLAGAWLRGIASSRHSGPT
jgi:hypothetical protein